MHFLSWEKFLWTNANLDDEKIKKVTYVLNFFSRVKSPRNTKYR